MPLPSKRLRNVCRWSSSREGCFDECKKKYWYSYYGSWEGWPKTPFDTREKISPLSEVLYRLKNMQPLCMFLGSTVHKVIEEALLEYKDTQKIPSEEVLKEKTVCLFQKGLHDSKEGLWKTHPKKYAHILEHENPSPSLEKEELLSLEKALLCITNWISSPIVQKCIFHPCSSIFCIETAHTFPLKDSLEAIVVYDMAIKWKKKNGEETTIIFDWKTGKESSNIEYQLFAYALSAQILFSLSLDTITVVPFFLSEGPCSYKKYGTSESFPLTEEKLLTVKTQAIEKTQEMVSLHPPEENLCPDPRLFAYTEDKRKCSRCCFQEICLKAEYSPRSFEELEQLCIR